MALHPIELPAAALQRADRLARRDGPLPRRNAATVTRSISTDPGIGPPCLPAWGGLMAILRIAVAGCGRMEPARRVSGTSASKFPNRCISAHIHAYLCGMRPVSPTMKALQIRFIQSRGSRMTCLIAMRKVVGSNPISRFASNPAGAQ